MSEADSPKTSRSEIANAVVIALSGLLVAVATYQADLWNSDEDINFSRAGILYTKAARMWDHANAREAVVAGLFGRWLDARLRNDDDVAAFYAERFPEDVRPVFDAWLALDPLHNATAPMSPLAMPAYAPAEAAQAAALEAQGDRALAIARRGKRTADTFAQAGTILSMALFFAGIAQIFPARGTRYALFTLAAVACVIGVVRIATLPWVTLLPKG